MTKKKGAGKKAGLTGKKASRSLPAVRSPKITPFPALWPSAGISIRSFFLSLARLKTRTKAFLIPGVILLLFILFGRGKKTGETYLLKPVDVDYTILASCIVSEPAPYGITAPSDGEIRKVLVREGEKVKKGQVLLQLDDYREQQDLSISMNNLEGVRLKIKNTEEDELPRLREQLGQDAAALTNARSYLTRLESIDEIGGVTKVDLDQARNNYQQALGRYNKTRLQLDSYTRSGALADLMNQQKILAARIELAKKNVADKRITAPYDGTVTEIGISEGESVRGGKSVLTIIEKKDWVLETNVDQKELPFLAMFQPAHVMLDAYPSEKIDAEIILICSGIDVSKGSCNLKLRIRENRPFIKHGMTGNVEIFAVKYRRALAIPSRFLEKKDAGGFVYAFEKKKRRRIRADYAAVGENWVILKNIPVNTVLALPGKN